MSKKHPHRQGVWEKLYLTNFDLQIGSLWFFHVDRKQGEAFTRFTYWMAGRSSKRTILIVDDDRRLLETIHAVLTQYEFMVEKAMNGDELRQIMADKSIDLILLDLGLGGEDGLALAREIRQGSDIPVIMLTGRSDVIDKVVGLEVGADDYITKPFHNRELIARIESVLIPVSTE